MKKSHILVLALSSIVVLSACERRQRPPKPAVAKTDDDKKKGEGTQVDTANPESENSPTPPATETAPQALVKADFDKAILGLFKTQAEALKALGLGIEISLFDSVDQEGVATTKAIIKGLDKESLDVAISAAGQVKPEERSEKVVAAELHSALKTAFDAAKAISTTYRLNDKEMNVVTDVTKEEVERKVVAAEEVQLALSNADAILHALDLLDSKDPELK